MYSSSQKITDRTSLAQRLAVWHFQNARIVFTNGCFDLLHLGHIDYLEKARRFGDRLVVGLNTDASVQRLKGPGRPVQDENSRARIMAALEFVDLVVHFDEDTPLDLILEVRPDILVKGDDYAIADIVGGREVMEMGGEVRTVALVKGHSTSGIVNKLKLDDNEIAG